MTPNAMLLVNQAQIIWYTYKEMGHRPREVKRIYARALKEMIELTELLEKTKKEFEVIYEMNRTK